MAIYIDITDLGINFTALLVSEKILTIILLVFLVLVNGLLVIKMLRKQRSSAYREARFSVRLSLALGGLILALFPELVFTLVLFGQHSHSVNCQTLYLIRVFDQELLPMVYACGLIILAVDLFRRSGGSSSGLKYGVFSAALPWVISLAVVCPLALSNADLWNGRCVVEQNKGHLQARITVSTLLPAGLVAIFGCFLLFCLPKQDAEGGEDAFDNINTAPEFDAKDFDKAGRNNFPKSFSRYIFGYEKENCYNYRLGDKNDSNRKRISYIITDDSQTADKEKRVLIMSCFVFLLSVVPFNALSLYITETYDREIGPLKFIYKVDKDMYMAYESTMWLRLTFPIILPFVWLGLSNIDSE